MAIITISRQLSSYRDEIAALLSSKLGCPLIERKKIMSDYFSEIANEYELRMLRESTMYLLEESSQQCTYLEYIKNKLIEMAKETSIVILGFGAQMMFADSPNALHFRIVASEVERKKRVKKLYNINNEEADLILKKSDKKNKKFLNKIYGADITDPSLYHVLYNTSIFQVEECVSSIISIYNERSTRLERQMQDADTKIINNTSELPMLKTESEIEFAKILDMYHIDWEYEPKTFPIEWDREGKVISAFSPDFYLTKFDTYIELTTMNQKYVTEKNKKVKKLRKLYPGTNVRIVYKKDFYSLVERFKTFEGE